MKSVITDYEGKVVEWEGTDDEALKKGLNVNCSRCSGCSGCSYCSGCSRCSDCSRCSYCEKKPLSVLTTDRWIICIRQDRTIKIGCQDHTADEWMAFTDDEITAMHSDALVFWRKWKPVIAAILSWKVIKVIHGDDQPIEDEIGRVQTESLADLLLTQLDADLCADKSPGELAKEVYQTIYANTEVLDNGLGGDQHHGFYLLGAILTGGQIDVNISDRDGMPFIDFMRNVFPADHQVWDHIELSRDEEH